MQGGISHKIVGRTAKRLWTPDKLTDARCWLDASDSGTITLSGSSITKWEDKIGSNDADDAVNSSNNKITTARPTIATAAQNGLDAVNFNGSQHFDHNTARGMLRNRSHALMAITFKWGSFPASGFRTLWNNADFFNVARRFELYQSSTAWAVNSRRLNADTSGVTRSVSTDPPRNLNYHIHIASCNWGTGDFEYWIDGTQIGTTATYPGTPGNTSDTDLGTGHQISTSIGAYYRSGGDIAPSGTRITEIFCGAKSSGSYTTADRELLEGYLAWKWGLEGNLPAGHPYKSKPPIL
jgi:hypothetical protein